MIVKCNQDLYRNLGMKDQIQTFEKGNKYYYYPLDSNTNQRLVEPDKGERVSFTDEEFSRYFDN